jgi:type IV pilus assembly protein PilB
MDKLGQKLVDSGLLSADLLKEASRTARENYKPLALVLRDEGYLPEQDLIAALGEVHGLNVVSLDAAAVDNSAVRAVPPRIASHYEVMPVSLDGGILTIAVSSPFDMAASEDIETNLGYRVRRVLATRSEIQRALRRYYGVGAETVERILEDAVPEESSAAETTHDLEHMAEDASVIRLVNQIMQEAIRDRATDIHFEVYRDDVSCRRRIDGILYETSLPRNIRKLYPAMVSRIKLMASLDIVERRLPQDGRARVNIGRETYDLRVSAVPSVHGEDIVVRILPTRMLFDLDQLGLSGEHRTALEEFISRPHGIVFVTGPTGSGKSTTLYACLSRLNTRDRKIITIEDPVEYEIRGITQTQVNPKIGLTFARALRSMLRHDPDVMMVGEVRDRETAETAIQTAMTGHLVMSTLHTNDAAGAPVRLTDMGVDPYLITSTVLVFAAQRLVRVICPDCREQVTEDGVARFVGRGCRACNRSGYRGRVAICELLPMVPDIAGLVLARSPAHEIRSKADSLGMGTLFADGIRKAAQGITTEQEVRRVTAV